MSKQPFLTETLIKLIQSTGLH